MATRYALLCGDQLFPIPELEARLGNANEIAIVMVEDPALCSRRPYHQQKIALVLSAMRNHAELLRKYGYTVHYSKLDQQRSLSAALGELPPLDSQDLLGFRCHGRGQHQWVERACRVTGFSWLPEPSPMFLTEPATFCELTEQTTPLQMGRFYQKQRKRLSVLMESDGQPRGGRWSFDEDNRRKLPRGQVVPELPLADQSGATSAVIAEVKSRFAEHAGDAAELWLPTDRAGALRWLQEFLEQRFVGFGTFEDAISQRSWSLFHSALSPLLNLGLLTPGEILHSALRYAEENGVPLNDLEGFVRQLIGWREFVNGVYTEHGEEMRAANSRNQTHSMLPSWSLGELGIPPFDDAIKTLRRTGWNHHIERLMVIANLMNLAQIEPTEVYEFFMTHYVDAYDWVMVPNVYGMGLNSDNNTFATKPYICGSNYWLKMSDYKKGDWCNVVDGLYWRFVERHQATLARNPRTAVLPANLKRLSGERRQLLFSAADAFMAQHTRQH